MAAEAHGAEARALPLDDAPLGVRVGGKLASQDQGPSFAQRRAGRPLARFSQPEEAPSFYLSLSDLMSLLLVFFVLIFALTTPGSPVPAPPPARVAPAAIAVPVRPAPAEDPWPSPAPVPDALRRGLAAVRGQGSGDPGLKSRRGPGSRRAIISPRLLTLVASSQSPPAGAVPGGRHSLSALMARVQKEMAAADSGVEVSRRDDRLVLRLPEAITFDLGRAEIKPAMLRTLGRLAATLRQRPGLKIVVSGHTDDLPINTERFASNWELSGARAAAVARALMERGLAARQFTIRGLADTQPVAPNDSEAHRQANRRVEIELRRGG